MARLGARKPPRVLLIDDDPGLPEVIELLLSREGYDALHAATVKDGLDRVAAAAPDVVITDLKLPDGTGLDVIQHLQRERPELPLILITSYSSLDSAIGALRAGGKLASGRGRHSTGSVSHEAPKQSRRTRSRACA